MSGPSKAWVAFFAVASWACGGGGGSDKYDYEADTPFDPSRPSLVPTGAVTPYTGSDPFVLEAQFRLSTGLDLHQKVIMRSCGGANGVCHNQKEYPDMHTAANFASLVGAPCNVQPGDWSTVFDRCERKGDSFRLSRSNSQELEIAWMEYVVGPYTDHDEQHSRPTETSPGIHLYLKQPLPTSINDPWDVGLFLREFTDPGGTKTRRAIASFETRWWVLADRKHLVADVDDYQVDAAGAVVESGLVQGDPNRNGNFGASLPNPVKLLNAGRPEESYLVGRLRGYIQNDTVGGTRMPLANQPPSIPEMLALMCFIEALQPGQVVTSLAGPINYSGCSYIANPQGLSLVGAGITWRGRIWPGLQATCGGCHGATSPMAGLDLVSANAYQRLKGASTQRPSQNLIAPGSLNTSYLWLKVAGDGSIVGTRMPQNGLGQGMILEAGLMNDLQAWIVAGALEDG